AVRRKPALGRGRGFAAAALVLFLAPAHAQMTPYGQTPTVVEPNAYPPALPKRKGPKPPRLAFHLLGEIRLEGPLPKPPPQRVDGKVGVPLRGGVAFADPVPGMEPFIDPAPAVSADEKGSPEVSAWVSSPDGKYRFRTRAVGMLEAEERSRFRKAWHEAWSL